MTKTEMKKMAQDVIVEHLATVIGSYEYEDFVDAVGDHDLAVEIIKAQMDRVAKMFGYRAAWFE